MTHDEAYPLLADLLWMRVADEKDHALREHVEECSECQARLGTLSRLHGSLSSLDSDEIPAGLRERVEEIPARYPQVAASIPLLGSGRRALAAVAGVAAIMVAAAVLALSLLGGGEPTNQDPFQSVEQIAVGDSSTHVGGRIELGEARGGNRMIRLSVHGLDASGGSYELWLASESGDVSAGTFRPDANGACIVILSAPDDDWNQATIVRAGTDAEPVATVDL